LYLFKSNNIPFLKSIKKEEGENVHVSLPQSTEAAAEAAISWQIREREHLFSFIHSCSLSLYLSLSF